MTRVLVIAVLTLAAAVPPLSAQSLALPLQDSLPAADIAADTASSTIVVHSLTTSTLLTPDNGRNTLYEAVRMANWDPQGNQIIFDPGLAGGETDHWSTHLTLWGDGDSINGSIGGTVAPQIKIHEGLFLDASRQAIRNVTATWIMTTDDSELCTVEGCHVGLDLDGETPWPGENGGLILDVQGTGHTIGGLQKRQRNFVDGCSIYVPGSDCLLVNNYVGIRANGEIQQNPPAYALSISGDRNRIGCTPNKTNYLAATHAGIRIYGDGGKLNTIRGNNVGGNKGGNRCLYGIKLETGAHHNNLGGSVKNEVGPNVLSHFTEAGIYIGEGCNYNAVSGNYIGVNYLGALAWTRGKAGVVIGPGTRGNHVGGSNRDWKNWIAGAKEQCVSVLAGATDVQVQGNYIGFTSRSTDALTRGHGVEVVGAKDVLIGGFKESATSNNGNVIGACEGAGVRLVDCEGPVRVQSNVIGLSPDLDAPLGCTTAGIYALRSENLIIGQDPPETLSDAAAASPPSSQYGNHITASTRGIHLARTRNVKIMGNAIGWTGTGQWNNSEAGILVDNNSRRVQIGGPGRENKIVGNGDGVVLQGGANDCSVEDNRIARSTRRGILVQDDAYAVKILGNRIEYNDSHGIELADGAHDVAVGEKTRPNELVWNMGCGVRIDGAQTNSNSLVGNWIGVIASPTPEKPYRWAAGRNRKGGVQIRNFAFGNTVGRYNRICSNDGAGVAISKRAQNNSVIGNYIGREMPENEVVGNGSGVSIGSGAHDNIIGGYDGKFRNRIAGNLGNGIKISGAGTDGNRVAYCYIGANNHKAAGKTTTVPDGNDGVGVYIGAQARENIIGAPPAYGYSVLICANTDGGVLIAGDEADRNEVTCSRIGTNKSGLFDKPRWGNGGTAVEVSAGAEWNVIGGPDGKGNQIAQGRAGVRVKDAHALVEYNEILANKIAGIDVIGASGSVAACHNTFRLNPTHVLFRSGATGMLGKTSPTQLWEQGGNDFQSSTHYAVDAYESGSGQTIMAEMNDWHTTSRSAVEAQIRFRNGDGSHTSVDYDPVTGGVSPSGDGALAMVTSLSAQPTAQGAAITFSLSSSASVTATITNLAGRPVKTVCARKAFDAGPCTLLWNASTDSGLRAPSGRYLLRLETASPDGGASRSMAPLTLLR